MPLVSEENRLRQGVTNVRKVYFVGVDDWNRPTFRSAYRKNVYYCDVYNLFDWGEDEETILAFYKEHGTRSICYKGNTFDAEPQGDPENPPMVELLTHKQVMEMDKMIAEQGGEK